MSTVNFIADPWEHPISHRIEPRSSEWMPLYRNFRLRLHWLLLWNTEVRILDTFVLFNRQFEEWVENPYEDEGNKSQRVKSKLLESGVIRVAIRRGFSTLEEVDGEMLRGNENFIWYPDGKPSWIFAKRLDGLLSLPTTDKQDYEIGNHRQIMKKAFEESAIHGTVVNEDFPIDGLPPDEIIELRELIGDEWTRSRIYRVLGYGINNNGKFRRPLWKHALKHPHAAEHLRRLADSCYHRAVHDDVGHPTRFPGTSLPLSLDLMYPDVQNTGVLGIQPRDSESLAFREDILHNAAVCIKGDVRELFQRFGLLSVADIAKMRDTKLFRDYHDLRRNPEIWNDRNLAVKMVDISFECLRELAKFCGASSIEKTASSDIQLVLRITRIGAALVTGLAIALTEKAVEAKEVLPFSAALLLKLGGHKVGEIGKRMINKYLPHAQDLLIHLNARIRPVSPSNPVVATVRFAGDVELPRLQNES